MKKLLLISVFIAVFILNLFAQEEKVYDSPEIVVTGTKTPTPLIQLNRSVEVITSEKIKELSVSSLPELLNLSLGLDVKQRGVSDIQSDISIRGGSFEQTLILINGIKISDPQTGHHNMNIPVNINDIERIEILRGPGSSIHGANALTGVINIITKQNGLSSVNGNLSYGSYGTYNMGVKGTIVSGFLQNNLSISKSHSNGYIHNTNYKNINLNYSPRFVFGNSVINIFTGYQDKKFGANGFYSDKYLNQYEETKTTLIAINSDISYNKFNISPKFLFRKHKDRYLLDYLRPAFYENNHKTDSYNFQLESSYESVLGTTGIGAEYGTDEIASSNLGNHSRKKYGLSIEQKSNIFESVDISLGGYLYKYDVTEWKFVPSFAVGINLIEKIKLFANYGKSFRLPTFTELYYTSPVQVGNKLLQPEETWTIESGLKFNETYITGSLSLYYREGRNLIDWSKKIINDIWTSENIAKLKTKGIELSLNVDINKVLPKIFIKSVSFGYSFIETDNSEINYISKYVADHLKNQYLLNVFTRLPLNISNNISMRYEQRINSGGYFICDTKFSKELNKFEFSFSVNNIFDKYYTDFSNIPLPGINILGEVKFVFGNE